MTYVSLPTQQFSLRFLDIKPSEFPMEQLGEFIRLLAELIGIDNKPRFSAVLDKSTAAVAYVAEAYAESALLRVRAANDPTHKANKVLEKIESRMREFGLPKAELNDLTHNTVICSIQPANEDVLFTVVQEGEIEGEITGVSGADETMHIQLRDWDDKIIRVTCNDVSLALEIAAHLRRGILRLNISGLWERMQTGWKPSSQKCFVTGFEAISYQPITNLMNDIRGIPGNGWKTIEGVETAWRDLRCKSAQ
jgi:hypothetical protein